jgi:hypothetical protein
VEEVVAVVMLTVMAVVVLSMVVDMILQGGSDGDTERWHRW